MDGEDHQHDNVVVAGQAEIDTRPPFRSVKEAVALFGERVLVREIYANKLKEIHAMENGTNKPSLTKMGALKAELEETKQSLDKAKEETTLMAYCINSLRQELEMANKELQKLKFNKERSKLSFIDDPKMKDDLKFFETTPNKKFQIKTNDEEDEKGLYAKARNVKFASPPSLACVIVSKDDHQFPNRSTSLKKTKRKPLVPTLGWLFGKRKGIQHNESPTVDAFC